jgi:DNA-3-methyladenine glycosylase
LPRAVSSASSALTTEFFNRPADQVARDLLGKALLRRQGRSLTTHIVTETEAYIGPEDLASHAAGGRRTRRTEIMFGQAGTLYVYFVYGMHWMLNVVTGEIGYPAAVLIRGIEDAEGPARLTKALNITGALNGKLARKGSGLWFAESGSPPPRNAILRTARIGVDYAGPVWAAKKYRFVLKQGVYGQR